MSSNISRSQSTTAPLTYQVQWGLFLSIVYLFILPIILYVVFYGVWGDVPALDLIAQVVAGFIVIAAMLWLLKPQLRQLMSLKDASLAYWLFIGVSFLFVSSMIWNTILIVILGDTISNANQDALIEAALQSPLWTGLLTLLIAPLAEELIFRYFIFRSLLTRFPVMAWILSITAFAGIHLIASIGSPSWAMDLWTMPSYLIASAILTYVYYRTDRFAIVVLVHLCYNAIVFSFMIGAM